MSLRDKLDRDEEWQRVMFGDWAGEKPWVAKRFGTPEQYAAYKIEADKLDAENAEELAAEGKRVGLRVALAACRRVAQRAAAVPTAGVEAGASQCVDEIRALIEQEDGDAE